MASNLVRRLRRQATTRAAKGLAPATSMTLEDLVRDELRPLIKEWLDRHLPPLVDRLVQAELERLIGDELI